jgi:sugar/nucleoside kinase (ribokinase family)
MRLAVIGSANIDLVHGPDGSTHRGWGGVLYTVVALASLAPSAQVLPLIRAGADVLPELEALLAAQPGVMVSGLRSDPTPNYRCELRYATDGRKQEVLRGRLAPLAWADVEEATGMLDGVLVNFITGHELELPTLTRLRAASAAPVAMDLHSLLLTTAADGRRLPCVPAQWEAWVRLADALQMNEAEAALLGGLGSAQVEESRLLALATDLLTLGPRWVVITRGDQGAVAVQRGPAAVVRCAAASNGPAADTTGCGDVFLAALGAGLVAGEQLAPVLAKACRAAGQASRLVGPLALRGLEPLYPDLA